MFLIHLWRFLTSLANFGTTYRFKDLLMAYFDARLVRGIRRKLSYLTTVIINQCIAPLSTRRVHEIRPQC